MTNHDDGADARAAMTRTLDLLWKIGVSTRPKRGPKPKLEFEHIVRSAIEIADADGLAGISMNRIAEREGVAVGSLYTYLPGKSTLLAVMLDTAVGWSSLPHTLPGGWRQRFETWAREDWELYQQHPWIIELATSAPAVPGPKMMAWMDSALHCLDDLGLSEPEKLAVVNAVDGYVRGTAREALAAAAENAGSGENPEVAARDAFVSRVLESGRYPRIARAIAADPRVMTTVDLEFGLQRLLDGIEFFIDSLGEGTDRAS